MRPALWILVIVCAVWLDRPATGAEAPTALAEFHFRRENILGTSFDLTTCAPDESTARRGEEAALAEIERLRRILSTYDPASEISRVNASRESVVCSTELLEVLAACDQWRQRSDGAFSPQLGRLIQLWREAEKADREPAASAIARLLPLLKAKAWSTDDTAHTVVRLSDQQLNVDSLGKGFVIGRTVDALRRSVPAIRGIMLDIGGDIRVWGQRAGGNNRWRIGVANPRQPGLNAPPLTEIQLVDRAVATSAAYERGFTIKGRRYSHILDPRTGRPADGVASATVVASDNIMANALATTLCVLKPEQGLKLVGDLIGVECLLVLKDGTQRRSPGFAVLEPPVARTPLSGSSKWPAGFGVALDLTLKTPKGNDARRPYVVVWVENKDGKLVRTVTLWAGNLTYLNSLNSWWSFSEFARDSALLPVTRATRRAGRYTIIWDGLDESGTAVMPGEYTIFLEVAREHGTHAVKSVALRCETNPAEAVISGSTEFEDAPVKFGPVIESP